MKRIHSRIYPILSEFFLDSEKLVNFATRSDLDGAPVLIWQVLRATARSAIVVSAVSPERWEEIAV